MWHVHLYGVSVFVVTLLSMLLYDIDFEKNTK